jgi:hypothetical protein
LSNRQRMASRRWPGARSSRLKFHDRRQQPGEALVRIMELLRVSAWAALSRK